jgi:hypothetical protein
MPALYRMPVVYVVLLAASLAVAGFRTRGHRQVSSTTEAMRTKSSETIPTPPAVPAVEARDGSEVDGILRTASGVRRKVVIKTLGERCRTEPLGGVPTGQPLDYFSIHFVYEEQGKGDAAMLRIGPSRPPALGWVRKASVFDWDTRVMALPTAEPNRPPLDVYREHDCSLAALDHRRCARHPQPGSCPLEGSEPAEARRGRPSPVIGLPILRAEARRAPDGSQSALYEVAAMVRETVPPPPPTEPPEDLKLALRQVYIAFVIDTTNSMQRAIDAVRRVVAELADERSPRYRGLFLHVALVEYRDEETSFPRVNDFSTPATLRTILERVVAAPRGDGTIPEAVFKGVSAALPGSGTLSWPAGALGDAATKLLVLIGDAPDHATDLVRAQELAAQSKAHRVTIAAVELFDPLLSRSEAAHLREQWRALAEGGYRPRRPGEGKPEVLAPVLARVAPEAGGDRERAVAEIKDQIQGLIDDRAQDALTIAQARQEEAERALRDYANSQRLTLNQLAPVLVDLHRGETRPEYRQDPRFQGQKAPSVRLGWIAERIDDQPLVTIGVLMAREELGVLIDELEAFEQAAEGAHDLTDLRRIGTAAAAGETAFLAGDRGMRTFAEHLERQGFPPPRPGSLLSRTQADLLQADRLYRDELRARLRDVLPRLDRLRKSSDWTDPLKSVDGMRTVPYDWIAL